MNKTATQVLEEQFARAAKEIADEIDAKVLFDLMIQHGWTRVELSRVPRTIASDINIWMHNECNKHWKQQGRVWIFESQEEAALFKLTWS